MTSKSQFLGIFVQYCILVNILAFGLAGCMNQQTVVSSSISPTPSWSPDLLRSHLRALNTPSSEGRKTSSRGFLEAANYIQSGLKEMGLQPVLVNEYRLQNAMLQYYISNSTVQLVGSDSLGLVLGNDYIVHQIKENVEVQFSPKVQKMLDSGIYQAKSNIKTASSVSTSSVHVAGYIPGGRPKERDSLLVLIAPLDGWGLQGQQAYTDGSDAGVSAAVLLEVTRRLADIQRTWSAIGPTVLVGFVSGTKGVCDGPTAFFRTFPWSKSNIERVIVLNDLNSCNWSKVIAAQQVTAPVTVLETDQIHFESNGTTPFYPWVRRDQLLRQPLLDLMVSQAMEWSESAFNIIWE